MATNGWKTSNVTNELIAYLRGLGPVGSLVVIDTELTAQRCGLRRDSVARELRMMQELGVIRYSAERGSREITVRVMEAHKS